MAKREKTVSDVIVMVAPAETAFHSRWRLTTLRRVDADLYQRLVEQRDIYEESTLLDDLENIETQGAAMVRGWNAACAVMEKADVPDDAYIMGMDMASGIQVAIGEHKGSIDRIQKRYGGKVIIVTPDEVAAMFAAMEILKAAKLAFPGAEIGAAR